MQRAAWGGKIEYLLTCIGYAVGIGNVWRFPYLAFKNGGGAFLIPFSIMLLVVGIPLMFMEVSWAQFASLGPITIWHINPLMKGLGLSMVLADMMITLYYNVIIAWSLYFLFASMRSQLPWETCGNPWNTPYCMETHKYRNLSDNVTLSTNETVFRSQLKSPSEEYFYRKVLQMSSDIGDSGTVVWELALCLLLAWIIVFAVLIRGIGSLGKVVYFTSLFPYVLLTVMLIRGVTLEGAWFGIQFYLYPDWSRLADTTVWSDAASQMFFALGTCNGSLLAMASYNKFHNNTLADSIKVPIINVCASIYAGFVTFSVLGYMAVMKGVGVADVAASGPGLTFVVYPECLTTLPVAPFWSILFFLMMLIIGLNCMFWYTECLFSSFMDEFPSGLRRSNVHATAFRAVGCVVCYLISLPMICNGGFYIFSLIDSFVGFPLLVVGVIETVCIVFVYGYDNFANDIEMMLGRRPNIVFRICWSVITPLIMMSVIVSKAIRYDSPSLFSGEYIYPEWAEGIGWLVVVICLVSIPVVFLYVYCTRGGAKLVWVTSRPTSCWRPALPSNRTGRFADNPMTSEDVAMTTVSPQAVT